MNTGIHYYRYKVCSKCDHVEKTFARNRLLYDEHLAAAVIGIDINQVGFLKKKLYSQSHCPARQIGNNFSMQKLIVRPVQTVCKGRKGNVVP